jgi:ElaB/YqjD/DUF883 family membrane-anchored ribosome-binding protein
MSDENPKINITGSNIQSGVTNIGGTQTFHGNVTVTMSGLTSTIGGMNAAEDQKVVLQKLIADLESALKQAPTDQQANAEKVAKRAKEAVEEAAAAQPDKEAVEAKANLLKKAAENVAGAMPVVLTIAMSIIAHLLKLGMS